MALRDLIAEIERLSERRQELWTTGEKSEEVEKITSKLNELYEERRITSARERAGDRAEITRRAKVETELERLMTG